VWLLYALVAVSASLSAINSPVRRTFIPSLLPADQLALAGGLITVAGAVVIGLAMPAFARYQRRVEREVTRPELVKPG
jgi:hypothetical protein